MARRGKNQLFDKTANPFNRVNFYISADDETFLDDLCYQVRRTTGYKVSKSEVVRALLEGARGKELDALGIKDFQSLKNMLFAHNTTTQRHNDTTTQ